MNRELARVVTLFGQEPSRTGSLLITFYGDTIMPRGGVVWLGTLLAFAKLLDIDGSVVRTAISRLAADGWFAREKVGRKSFYRLAATGRDRFERAIEHVYAPHVSHWASGFELILDPAADREAMRVAGFGSPSSGLWIAPAGTAVPILSPSAIRLDASADADNGRRLIAASWTLDRTAEAYRDFIATFAPLAKSLHGKVDDAEALLARILLIHNYRRAILHDPLLPPALLPEDWPAAEARALCADIYRAVTPASERWLDAHGEEARGPLPRASETLKRRFADI